MKRQIISHDAGSCEIEQAVKALRQSAPQPLAANAVQLQSRARPAGDRTDPAGAAPAMTSNRPAGRNAALRWAGAGFLTGIVFWHFVGFWVFLSDVVLNENGKLATGAELAASGSYEARPAPRRASSVQFDPARRRPVGARAKGCTTLVLERATGRTRSLPCREIAMPMVDKGTAGRQGPASWAVIVAPGIAPKPAQGVPPKQRAPALSSARP